MTIIIALKDEEEECIWMGCDTQGTTGDTYKYVGDKIFDLEIPVINCDEGDEEFVKLHIGISGDSSLVSYVKHSFQPPSIDTRWDFISYLYNKFFQQLQEELNLHKQILIENEVIDTDSNMMIIYNNEIYEAHHDFSIFHEKYEDYSAIGSGWKIGEAVIHNLLNNHNDMDKKEMLKEALLTVAELNIYCNDDIIIKKIKE